MKEDPLQPVSAFNDTAHDAVAAYLGRFPNVEIHPGRIQDTAAGVAGKTFSFVHLDVDLYEPTLFALRFFDSRLADGGIIVVDDFASLTCPGVQQAVNEFEADKSNLCLLPFSDRPVHPHQTRFQSEMLECKPRGVLRNETSVQSAALRGGVPPAAGQMGIWIPPGENGPAPGGGGRRPAGAGDPKAPQTEIKCRSTGRTRADAGAGARRPLRPRSCSRSTCRTRPG